MFIVTFETVLEPRKQRRLDFRSAKQTLAVNPVHYQITYCYCALLSLFPKKFQDSSGRSPPYLIS